MNEEKVKNLLLNFAESIPQLPITKAMKLLFYADFICFAESGSSITGLDYHSWDQGPVPPLVHKRLDKGRFDFMTLERVGRSHLVRPAPGFKADLKIFNDRERDIIERVLRDGKDAGAAELSNQTHREIPWSKTERYAKISYEWAGLQQAVMESGVSPNDDEIILDVVERNPALHHFFESSLADWLDSSSEDEIDDFIDERDLTPVHWQKGVGWVQGH